MILPARSTARQAAAWWACLTQGERADWQRLTDYRASVIDMWLFAQSYVRPFVAATRSLPA